MFPVLAPAWPRRAIPGMCVCVFMHLGAWVSRGFVCAIIVNKFSPQKVTMSAILTVWLIIG